MPGRRVRAEIVGIRLDTAAASLLTAQRWTSELHVRPHRDHDGVRGDSPEPVPCGHGGRVHADRHRRGDLPPAPDQDAVRIPPLVGQGVAIGVGRGEGVERDGAPFVDRLIGPGIGRRGSRSRGPELRPVDAVVGGEVDASTGHRDEGGRAGRRHPGRCPEPGRPSPDAPSLLHSSAPLTPSLAWKRAVPLASATYCGEVNVAPVAASVTWTVPAGRAVGAPEGDGSDAVRGGEEEPAADTPQGGGARRCGSGPQIGHLGRARGGAVALPQLDARDAVRGREVGDTVHDGDVRRAGRARRVDVRHHGGSSGGAVRAPQLRPEPRVVRAEEDLPADVGRGCSA